eukprot:SAG11_NODE_494_length_8948_cov_2.882699_3_plen_160_part_00
MIVASTYGPIDFRGLMGLPCWQDNGPEVNCGPEGRCGSGSTGEIPPGTLHRPHSSGPGSAGGLRGRKRDVWEGGHRVPGIISWPAMIKGPARQVWQPVVTMGELKQQRSAFATRCSGALPPCIAIGEGAQIDRVPPLCPSPVPFELCSLTPLCLLNFAR